MLNIRQHTTAQSLLFCPHPRTYLLCLRGVLARLYPLGTVGSVVRRAILFTCGYSSTNQDSVLRSHSIHTRCMNMLMQKYFWVLMVRQ